MAFSSRLGRFPLCIAKVLAGGLSAALAAVLVSMFTGSGVAALAVSAGVMLAAMQQYQGDWAEYLPVNLVDERALTSLRLTNLFGLKLNFIRSGFLLYLLIAVVLFALCWLGWRRNAACVK